MQAKKVTKATFKSFLNKNKNNIFIKETSRFDGMTDCVQSCDDPKFVKVEYSEEFNDDRRCGYQGIWLVGDSRDYFTPMYIKDILVGFQVYNCCGSFEVRLTSSSV